MHKRILRINAGGRRFDTLWSTICRFPTSGLARAIEQQAYPLRQRGGKPPANLANGGVYGCFLDCDPAVFEVVLRFLRGGVLSLPASDEVQRRTIVSQLDEWGLTEHAFPAQETDANDDNAEDGSQSSSSSPSSQQATTETPLGRTVVLPDVVVVQLSDHMQLEQGVKRHAMTITYGADGFRLRRLCTAVRKDLNTQVSNTYWQMYQTNERAAFFVSSKMSNGSADLLMTSVAQNIVAHTESIGYTLTSSYVTLSPDMNKTSVRVFIHWMIFRRVRSPTWESGDTADAAHAARHRAAGDGEDDEGLEDEEEGGRGRRRRGSDGVTAESDEAAEAMFRHYEPPAVGPQPPMPAVPVVPLGQRISKIWE